MKLHATPALILVLTLLLAAGCNKNDREETPAPRPEPTATFSRSIRYHDNTERRDTTYPAQTLGTYAGQNAQTLTVGVHAKALNEGIRFALDRARLPAALSGTYTLRTAQEFLTRDADLTYYFDVPPARGGGTSFYLSNSQTLTGSFTIAAYDANRQLLSGTYTTTLVNAPDPRAPAFSTARRRCDIIISGSFTDIPLKQVD